MWFKVWWNIVLIIFVRDIKRLQAQWNIGEGRLKSLGETIVYTPIAQAIAVINAPAPAPKPHAIMPTFYNAATSVASTLWRGGHRVDGRRRSARHRPWIGLVLSNEHLGFFASPGGEAAEGGN
jgi:hypothetical protein